MNQRDSFSIETDVIELVKLLKLSGLAETGGQAKWAVAEGRVKVNGKTEKRKAYKIRRGDRVSLEGCEIEIISSRQESDRHEPSA